MGEFAASGIEPAHNANLGRPRRGFIALENVSSPPWTPTQKIVQADIRLKGTRVMLTAAGNINQSYTTLGVIHAVVVKPAKDAGCSGGGGLPIQEAFDTVLKTLEASAAKSGGDGLIHVSYDYRVSSTSMACNQSKAVIEVYGWGTVIRLEPT